MALLATKYQTLVDLMKQTVGDSVVTDIAEMMSEDDVVIANLHVKECNDGTANTSVIRTGLPTGTFRQLYGFVAPEKSETVQVKDITGMLEAYSVVDVDLVDKAKNPKQFRLNESRAFIEGMTQTASQNIFYGSVKDNAAKFDGLAVRYSKLSDNKRNIGFNIVDGKGKGSDNASVWLVTTGENDIALIYPQGSQGGLKHEDDGIVTETNKEGGKRKVYQDHYKHDLGVTVKDWRSTCRIANISISELQEGKVDLLDLLRQGYFKIKKYAKGTNGAFKRTFIFCNSTVAMYLDKAACDKSNVNLSIKEYCGEDITHYKNIPILTTDVLLDTEDRVE